MILADTHILVWLTGADRRLPTIARDALLETAFAVSIVTAFEYVDLQTRGRLAGAPSFDALMLGLEFTVVPLPLDAWRRASVLPEFHRDPVDRMLIAHALTVDATLATADANIRRYPVKTLW